MLKPAAHFLKHVLKHNLKHAFIIILTSALLPSCTLLDFIKPNTKATSEAQLKQNLLKQTLPNQWIAPLPHQGSLKSLNEFWAQYQDLLLLTLINAAEQESVTLASAKTRIMQARANRISANGALLPSLDGTMSASRAIQQPPSKYNNAQQNAVFSQVQSTSASNTARIGLQAAWELDLFGKNAAALDASRANLLGAESSWHEARVSLAAEVAKSYFDYRFCSQKLALNQADAASRLESAMVTDALVKAGFKDETASHLAHASDASAQQQVLQQAAMCESNIKELVALSNLAEADLHQKIAQNTAPILDAKTVTALFSLTAIPADVIAQRPDLYSAEQQVVATMAELQNSQLQRLPKISLNGSIGLLRLSNSNFTANGNVWSLGPISITLPIFDGGTRKANIEANQVKLDEAFSNYRSKVRIAVKEVEQALVALDSTAKRVQSASLAAVNYQAALTNTQVKYKAGFASMLELEDTRRSSLQADSNLVNLSQERNNAWITLYRAAGGGWNKALVGAENSTLTQPAKPIVSAP